MPCHQPPLFFKRWYAESGASDVEHFGNLQVQQSEFSSVSARRIDRLELLSRTMNDRRRGFASVKWLQPMPRQTVAPVRNGPTGQFNQGSVPLLKRRRHARSMGIREASRGKVDPAARKPLHSQCEFREVKHRSC